jgi:hypothetical protein
MLLFKVVDSFVRERILLSPSAEFGEGRKMF